MIKRLTIPAIFLAGCSHTPAANYTPVTNAISFPNLGIETKVSLGEDMLKQGFYTETDGVKYSSENNIGGYRLSAGFYPMFSEDEKFTYHSYHNSKSPDGTGYILSARDALGLPLASPQSIRVSKSSRQTCIIIGGIFRPVCDTERAYERTRQPALSDRDLQQTLIYSGRVGSKIKIGYREASGGYARTAFSNEAEYDLSSSTEIAYRGARVRILGAHNQRIRYVVLKNFNSAN